MAQLPAAQRADAQGPDLRADRRADRGGHDLAARDARRRAQLGLPLHLDPRLDVRAVGPVHARLRLGGERLLLLHRRRRRDGDDDLQIMYGIGGERELDRARRSTTSPGYDGARPGADRQRRLRPAPARRLGCAARLGLPARQGRATSSPSGSGRSSSEQVEPGARALARAGPRHLGGARRAQALHLVARSCAGWRSTAAPGWPGCTTSTRVRRASGRPSPTRSRPTSASNGVDERGVLHPALRHRRARRVAAADAAGAASCRRTTRGSGPPCWRSPTS